MLTRNDILYGVVLPGLLSLVILLISWRAGRGTRGHWGGAPAIAGAFVLAFATILRFRKFPPADEIEKLAVCMIGLGVVGLIWAITRVPRWVMAIVIGLITAGMMAWVFQPVLENTWPREQSIGVIVGLGVFGAIGVWLLDPLAERNHGLAMPVWSWIVAASISALLMLSGSQKMGQMGGAMAAGVGGFLVLGLFSRNLSMSRGTMAALVPLGIGLLGIGHVFADLKLSHAILAGVALPVAWVGEVRLLRRLKTWQRVVIVAFVILIVLAFALVPTVQAFLRDSSASGPETMYY